MIAPQRFLPQYFLYCDSRVTVAQDSQEALEEFSGLGYWHFVLERSDGQERLEAFDKEPHIHRDRVALLSVVRGLESLEQTGQVQLITTSRYVDRGLRFGLPNWRETNFQWESFGLLRPVRNADLWQRVAVALQFHEVDCRFHRGRLQYAEPVTEHIEPRELVTWNSRSGQNGLIEHSPMGSRYVVSHDLARRAAARVTDSGQRRQWWEMAASWLQAINEPHSPIAAGCGM